MKDFEGRETENKDGARMAKEKAKLECTENMGDLVFSGGRKIEI